MLAAVTEPRIQAQYVVHHISVADRTRAAGVVAGHPAQRGLRRSRHVHRKAQLVRLELDIETIEHDPRLDHDLATCNIELDDAVQIFRVVDDQRCADGLTALGGARPTWENRHARFHGDLERDACGLLGARYHHAHRLDLVDRRVGAVASPAESVEQDLPIDLGAQATLERAMGSGGRVKTDRCRWGVHSRCSATRQSRVCLDDTAAARRGQRCTEASFLNHGGHRGHGELQAKLLNGYGSLQHFEARLRTLWNAGLCRRVVEKALVLVLRVLRGEVWKLTKGSARAPCVRAA